MLADVDPIIAQFRSVHYLRAIAAEGGRLYQGPDIVNSRS
jgi:hypothetical protein